VLAGGAVRGAARLWRRGVSIGAALAEARERAGLSVAQVSERTRIRETVIGGDRARRVLRVRRRLRRAGAHPRHRQGRRGRPRAAGRGVRRGLPAAVGDCLGYAGVRAQM